jgi:hypothetical protein
VPPERLRPHVSTVQVLASALAAACAALVSTFLHMRGTVVGAVVGAVVATVASAVVATSLHRTNARLRRLARLPASPVPQASTASTPAPGWTTYVDTRPRWGTRILPVLATVAVVFAVVLGSFRGVETAVGSGGAEGRPVRPATTRHVPTTPSPAPATTSPSPGPTPSSGPSPTPSPVPSPSPSGSGIHLPV